LIYCPKTLLAGQIERAVRFSQNVKETPIVYVINCEKSKFGPDIPCHTHILGGQQTAVHKNPSPGLVCVQGIGSADLKVAAQQLVLFEQP
jgi:hypothetical protein